MKLTRLKRLFEILIAIIIGILGIGLIIISRISFPKFSKRKDKFPENEKMFKDLNLYYDKVLAEKRPRP